MEIEKVNYLLFHTKKNEKNALENLKDINQKIDVRTRLINTINLQTKLLSKEINANQRKLRTLNKKLKDLKADYIIANPPFNVSDWSGDLLRKDARWQFGTPPPGNANYAWIQHFMYHLAPNGQAGFVELLEYAERKNVSQKYMATALKNCKSPQKYYQPMCDM